MRRMLVIGLALLCSTAVPLGLGARYYWMRSLPAAVADAEEAKPEAPVVRDAAADAKAGPPIPQDAAAIEKRRRDFLAWNRRTLREAYDRAGKKDPRWDEPALEALDLAARMFSDEVDPQVTLADIHQPAKAALDAGCDDPMLLYLHARTSVGAYYPGLNEAIRRVRVAARSLAASRYPAFRRAVAHRLSGVQASGNRNVREANRKEAEHDFDAALALIAESVAGDEQNGFWEATWINTLMEVTGGLRNLGATAQAAYERVDGAMASVDGAKLLRLLYRGNFWFQYGWEARTPGFASAVPEGGFDTLEKRLAIAREAYFAAWELRPDSSEVARNLMEIDKAVGGDRATMELWFERAMKADGDDREACWSKLDWLTPKWHGTPEEMLAFGRACRDTKNSRTGITLLVADAHWRMAAMAGVDQIKYMNSPAVWADIQLVYDEYLKHHPIDDVARSKFAMFCNLSGHYRAAEVQFVTLGDRLTQWSEFPYVPLHQLKQRREHNAKIVMGKDGQITIPGWHFARGSGDQGEWFVNTPVQIKSQKEPGILGASEAYVSSCSAGGVSYRMRAQTIPVPLRNESREHILEAARSVVAKERGARPRDVRDTLLAARPAQEYIIDLPGRRPMQLRVKTVVLGTWLFELSVAASKSDVMGPAACEFFDSLAFQPKEKPALDADGP